MKKRVAVLGGGPCGLGALHALKDEGFDAVGFERTDSFGGLWRYRENDIDGVASVMKSTIINTSKEVGAFSTLPPPAHYPNYMHQTLMLEYIKMMAEKSGVLKQIRFHHKCVKVEPTSDYKETGCWIVTTENNKTKEVSSEIFDAVMVCVGHHVFPNVPTFPGQEKFRGEIMHTHSLKKSDGFEDKNVVVVGVGNSGMDAAVEISNVAKQVYLSSRRGTWVMPRVGPKGHPIDTVFMRRYMAFIRRFMPYSLSCSYTERFVNERFDHAAYGLKPKHRILSQHPTISDILPIKLLSGVVLSRANIKEFTEDGVIFENEEKETKADAVVLATGYCINYPFLSQDIISTKDNRVTLYKFVFPPELPHPSLAIMGLIQPNGPGFPVGEMQCRWVARIFKGKCSLPSKETMYEDINKLEEFNRKKFVDSPRHTIEVDFMGYTDELAEKIGAKPNLLKLAITDPKLFRALIFGPFLPYQFRLQGPNSWDGARDAILTYKDRVMEPLRKPGQAPYKPKTHSTFKLLVFLAMIVLVLSFVFQTFQV